MLLIILTLCVIIVKNSNLSLFLRGNMKRIFSIVFLLVILALSCAVIFSCNSNKVNSDDFGDAGYILDGKIEKRPDYIMTVGDMPVTFQEYRYHYLNTKMDYDGGNEDVWEDYPEYINVLKNTVQDSIVEIYSVRTLCDEAGVESDFDDVYAQIDEFQEGMSRKEFNEGLETHFLTRSLYAYILEGYQLYDKLFEYYFGEDGKKVMSDDEVIDYAEKYYYHTKHIMIYPNTTMTEEAYNEHLDEILDKVDTEDFEALVTQYSNDVDMPEYGYYFTDNEMHENYFAAAENLKIGEVSDLVLGSDGWYIIKRLPIDEKDIEVLRDTIYNRKYADMIENKIDTINVQYSEEYYLIAPTTLK